MCKYMYSCRSYTSLLDPPVGCRVFDEISFRENFAKLATKRFSCFAKMRDEFREFRSFAKLPGLRKKRFLRNTKIAKMKKT